MSLILTIIFALISISQAALTCNGVEYTISTLTTTVPTDVCYNIGSSVNTISYWYKCINQEVYINQYSNQDCIGDPIISTAFTVAYASATSLQQECNLSPCEVSNVRKISAVWTDCLDLNSTLPTNLETTSFIETPFIQHKCINKQDLYSESWSCSIDGSQATYSYYSTVTDCTGTPTQTITINTNEISCDNTNNGIGGTSGIPIYVTCETASFSGTDATLPPSPAVTVPIYDCSNTALTCKAVEWNINGVTMAYPLDVCYSVEATVNDVTTAASYWYKCKKGIPYISMYQAADCKGNAVDTLLVNLYPLSEYVTVCCNLDPCKYVVTKTYSSVDLDCSDANTTDLEAYTSIPFVEGYCNAIQDIASYKWSCDGSDARKDYFSGNGQCNGDPTITLFNTKYDVSCDDTDQQTAASVAIGLECGIASFNGGGNNNNNNGGGGQPTAPTTATSNTPCPSVGCNVGNQNKGYYKGYGLWMWAIVFFVAYSTVF